MTLADDAPVRPSPPLPGTFGRLLSRAYSIAINRVNRRFDKGVGVVTLDRPVISVGNLSTGGTGKTPMVMSIIRTLQSLGHNPCIAMRGYKSTPDAPSDEMLEYARSLTSTDGGSIPIVAQPDRLSGLFELFATERGEAVDVVVLDDGFQHRKIARDLNIVLIDATRSPFRDALLPAGHLREPVSSLSRADAVVVTHAECSHADDVATLHVQIHERQPKVLIAVARHAWRCLLESTPAVEIEHEVSVLAGKKVAAVAAIGNPLAFFDHVREQTGHDLCFTMALRDHDPYADATIEGLIESLRGVRPDALVTTEKDWSKLRRVPADRWPCPVLRPALELEFTSGGQELVAMIQRVMQKHAQDESM